MFDLNGTLTDPGVGFVRCVQHAFGRLGLRLPPSEVIRRHVGPPLRETLRHLLDARHGLVEPAVALYHKRYVAAGIWETTPYPGISQAIERLSGVATPFVVTSKPTAFARQIVAAWPFAAAFKPVHGAVSRTARGTTNAS